MKPQEQRIEDAAGVIATHDGYDMSRDAPGPCHLEIARQVLEAADREPPVWPTDESIAALNAASHDGKSSQREIIRAAFLADPIIKAAIAYRNERTADANTFRGPEGNAVIDAVNEAGL
jgi:hypothetical protein